MPFHYKSNHNVRFNCFHFLTYPNLYEHKSHYTKLKTLNMHETERAKDYQFYSEAILDAY